MKQEVEVDIVIDNFHTLSAEDRELLFSALSEKEKFVLNFAGMFKTLPDGKVDWNYEGDK